MGELTANDSILVEEGQGAQPARLTELDPEPRLLDEPLQCVRKGWRLAGGDEEAGLAGHHLFPTTADIRRDHG